MTAHRPLAVVLAFLLALACAFLAGVPTGDAAPAASSPHVRLDVEDIQPVVASPGEVVTVSGTISNPTDHFVTPTVTVQVSPQLLDTLTRVDDWTAGRFQTSGPTVGHQTLTTIPPGGHAEFAVRIPRKALDYTYHLASLPMTVSATGDGMKAQQVRTTLQWSSTPPAHPMQTTVLVPLTLPADPALFGPSGPARVAAWQRAIGPGSRIDRLLTAMQGLPVTWVVDPALLTPPAAADPDLPAPATPGTTSPPTGEQPTGPTTPASPESPETPATGDETGAPATGDTEPILPPSTDTDEAPLPTPPPTGDNQPSGEETIRSLGDRLLQQLRTAADTGTVWWTPWSDPDLRALSNTTAGRAMLTRRLHHKLSADLRDIGTTTVAWPVAAVGSAQAHRITSTWRKATGKKPLMILPGRSVTSPAAFPDTTRRTKGSAGVLSYDETLTDVLSSDRGNPTLAAQRFLARTIAIYQQQPGSDRSLSIAFPRDESTPPRQFAAAVRRVLSVPWLDPVTGATTLTQMPTKADAQVVKHPPGGKHHPAPAKSPIDTSALRQVAADRRILHGLGSVLVDATSVLRPRLRALDMIGSTRWRGQAEAFSTTLHADSDAVRSLRKKVSVSPSTVNFFTSSGELTVTVVNHLSRPLKNVELSMVPRRYLLRFQHPTQSVTLRPSSRTTVRFHVKAIGAGRVQVDAILRTPTGLELGATPGDPEALQVNVRPTSSWIYWALGIVAGLVLIIGLVRSVRRGPRDLTTPGPADEPVAADPTQRDDDPEVGEDD